jgi:hypothetical protein
LQHFLQHSIVLCFLLVEDEQLNSFPPYHSTPQLFEQASTNYNGFQMGLSRSDMHETLTPE